MLFVLVIVVDRSLSIPSELLIGDGAYARRVQESRRGWQSLCCPGGYVVIVA